MTIGSTMGAPTREIDAEWMLNILSLCGAVATGKWASSTWWVLTLDMSAPVCLFFSSPVNAVDMNPHNTGIINGSIRHMSGRSGSLQVSPVTPNVQYAILGPIACTNMV